MHERQKLIMKKAYIVLEDGMVFEGTRFGAESDACGELVLSTGVRSYTELLTDPMNTGKIILSVFPEGGVFGVIPEDFEGESAASGFIVRSHCNAPGSFRSREELDTFMLFHGIAGICDVNTRALSRYVRAHGTARAGIFSVVPPVFPAQEKVAEELSAQDFATYAASSEVGEKYFVALIDYGTKASVVNALRTHGCKVRIVPADTSAKDIFSLCPDGVVISGGADAIARSADLSVIKEILGKVPVMGISLGHLLLARAQGASLINLPSPLENDSFPVRDLENDRVYIAWRESAYAVETGAAVGEVLFENADTGVCEGICYAEKLAFSVQFCPKCDTEFIYDKFIDMMKGRG